MKSICLSLALLATCSLAIGCKDTKSSVVSEYEKDSGNDVEKDPAGSVELAWFQSNQAQAQHFVEECAQIQQKQSFALGSQEFAVCANAKNAISFQHHYDNTH